MVSTGVINTRDHASLSAVHNELGIAYQKRHFVELGLSEGGVYET